MGSTEGRSVVVKENRPLGDLFCRDYEPGGWWVRSRLGKSVSRNRFPPGICRSKLEERKVEEDCAGVGAKEGVEFGGDERRVLGICVHTRYGGSWYGYPRYHPRVGVCLLVVVDAGSPISIIQRSPARKGVTGRDSQSRRTQEGSRHPCVPGRTSDTRTRGSPRVFI